MGPELVIFLYFAAGATGIGGASALLMRHRKKKQKLKDIREHRRSEIERHASHAETALADCQDAENDLRYLRLDVGAAADEVQDMIEEWRECIADWRRNAESQRAAVEGGETWPDMMSLDELHDRSANLEIRLRQKTSEIRERPRRAAEAVRTAEEELRQVREKLRNLESLEGKIAIDESSAALEEATKAVGESRHLRAIDLAERSVALSGKASGLIDSELSRQRALRSTEELLMTRSDRLERAMLAVESLPKLRGLDELIREAETCLEQARESIVRRQPKRAQSAIKQANGLIAEIEKRVRLHREFLSQQEARQRPFGPDVPLELQREYRRVRAMVSSAVSKNRGKCPMCGRKGSHRCRDGKSYLLGAKQGKRLYVRPMQEAKRLMGNPATAELARPILECLASRAALDLQRKPHEPVDAVLATINDDNDETVVAE